MTGGVAGRGKLAQGLLLAVVWCLGTTAQAVSPAASEKPGAQQPSLVVTPNEFEGTDVERINRAIEAAAESGRRVVIPRVNHQGTARSDVWLIDSASAGQNRSLARNVCSHQPLPQWVSVVFIDCPTGNTNLAGAALKRDPRKSRSRFYLAPAAASCRPVPPPYSPGRLIPRIGRIDSFAAFRRNPTRILPQFSLLVTAAWRQATGFEDAPRECTLDLVSRAPHRGGPADSLRATVGGRLHVQPV